MSKLEYNKKQKKDALLNTAFDLFITKGIQKTSIADIVEKAGVAKGTFYLYFTDKYDLRNKLISHKANQLLTSSYEEMKKASINSFEDQMIFMADRIIDHLVEDKSLLFLIAKHLSWGLFKNAMTRMDEDHDKNVYELYEQILSESGHTFHEPEIMIYMIIEMVSGCIYSPILYEQPVSIEEMKPYIYNNIRFLIQRHTLE